MKTGRKSEDQRKPEAQMTALEIHEAQVKEMAKAAERVYGTDAHEQARRKKLKPTPLEVKRPQRLLDAVTGNERRVIEAALKENRRYSASLG